MDREIVVWRIFAMYTNVILNHKIEGRKLYRTKLDRKHNIQTLKATWFRKLGATTTLKGPAITNSELAKEIRLVLGQLSGPKGTSIKV